MIFTPDAYADIIRYYRGTFLKFKETGDKLFYINKVASTCIQGSSEDDLPFELYLSKDYPLEVDYILPRKAYFQYDSYACLLHRIPAKQYQRGISPENTKIRVLDSYGKFVAIGLDFTPLKAFVTKQAYTPFLQAIEHKGSAISFALTSRMAYVVRTRNVYIDDLVVGKVNKSTKTILLRFPIFMDEMLSLIKGTNYKVVYENK
jgi:hypothetical protein